MAGAAETIVAADGAASPRWQVKLLAIALMLVVTLVAAEAVASALYYFAVSPQLDARRADPGHYYRLSKDPLLGYELTPGFQLRRDNRDLMINSFGLRGPEPDKPKAGLRFAVLGDSVTFGIQQAEAQTIPHLMQSKLRQQCRTAVEVLNLGVAGYGAQELNEMLKTKAPLLALDGVVYLLNLNDFARRNSLWEGADSGLYRMYWPPTLKLPFFLQKALYRWEKGSKDDGMAPSLDWYRWLIHGTLSETFDEIGEMKAWADSRGIGFAVSIFPSGVALSGGANALADQHRAITDGLRTRGVAVFDEVDPFLAGANLFDETDHLTDNGNDVASTQLVAVLKSVFPDLAAKAGCKRE